MRTLYRVGFLAAKAAYDPPGLTNGEDADVRLTFDNEPRAVLGSDSFDRCNGVESPMLDGQWERQTETDNARDIASASPRSSVDSQESGS